MSTDPSSPAALAAEQILVRQAGFGASVFLAFAVGYVLSLRTLSFDIVIPSIFVWACISGIILASSGVKSFGQVAKRCAFVSGAFAFSPVMFATLRGILAAMSGDIPDMTNALGYGVFNFSSFSNSFKTLSIIYTILFVTSFILLMAATYAGEWFVFVVSKIFLIGSDGIEKVNATLLKAGATLGIMGAAVVFVANLNKKDEFSYNVIGYEATTFYDISAPVNGFLEIIGSRVGFIEGRLNLESGESLMVLIPQSISESIIGREETTDLLTKPLCDNLSPNVSDCAETMPYNFVKLKFSKKLKVSIFSYLIVSSLEKIPDHPIIKNSIEGH